VNVRSWPLRRLSTLIHLLSTAAMARSKDTARVRPSDAHMRTGATRRRNGFPEGVSKTLSGKFQARIKLNGKRYDLGSNFTSPEEAGAAYQAAKQAGATQRASPRHARVKRGTGTSRLLVILLIFLCFSPLALSCVVGRTKGFGAHYSASAARGAFPWLPGEPAATRTACSCGVARWSLGRQQVSTVLSLPPWRCLPGAPLLPFRS
jgi:hypothetical protein